MGGIADYSGSLVLQMPLREATTVRAVFTETPELRIHSADVGETFTLPLPELQTGSYESLRQTVLARPGGDWAVYVVGCLAVLTREKGLPPRGLDVWVSSAVPLGKGVSSSAALEVAVLRALCPLYEIELPGTELPRLAQRAENLVVGSPCGLMDQLASCFGQPGHLLPILCQPDALFPTLALPGGLRFVGLDSGIRHAVSGASYGQVRAAAFMGYTLLARLDGVSPDALAEAHRTGDWSGLPYGGFLSNIPPSLFEERYAPHLPERLTGAAFRYQFGDTIDPVAPVNEDATYAVRACTRHPVYENFRVNAFSAALERLDSARLTTDPPYRQRALGLLGELMYQSHASYSACGLGNRHTDDLVRRVRRVGPVGDLYGAKITGGGSGGTVCVLAHGEVGVATARHLLAEYAAIHGMQRLHFFG
jgi:L-arabinokinase